MSFSAKSIVSFRLDQGLLGFLFEEKHPKWTTITALSVPESLPRETEQVIGSAIIAVVYVLVVFGFPLAMLVCSGVLIFGDLTMRERRKVLKIINVLESVCALDILAISCLAAYMEMHLVLKFSFEQQYPKFCASGLTEQLFGTSCIGMSQELHPIGFGALVASSVLFLANSEAITHAMRSTKEMHDLGYWTWCARGSKIGEEGNSQVI
jgi:uncharacterized paraquat-inducible protein A